MQLSRGASAAYDVNMRTKGENRVTDMKKAAPVAFSGGDARMIYAAKSLAARGFDVFFAAGDEIAAREKLAASGAADIAARTRGEALAGAGALVLPLPVSRDGIGVYDPIFGEAPPICEVVSALAPGAKVFCGMAAKLAADAARDSRVDLVDYYADEGFLIRNAALTAEGAIAELIRLTPRAIAGSRVVIFGYGRCASQLARRLIALGARVTVVARSAKRRAQALADGALAASPEAAVNVCREADAAVNTVPAPVIGLREAAALDFVLELADRPGVSEEAAKVVKVVRAAGLPGRFCPASAGEIIADFVADRLTVG